MASRYVEAQIGDRVTTEMPHENGTIVSIDFKRRGRQYEIQTDLGKQLFLSRSEFKRNKKINPKTFYNR